MGGIIFSLFAFALVQLVSSQDACTQAQLELTTDAICSAALVTGTDFNTLCMGSCRTLLDDVLRNCDAITASVYSNLIDTLCNACGMAQQALVANTDCANTTDTNTVCMGTCRNLIDDIINNCNDSVSTSLSTTISTICGGNNTGDACTTAATALTTNTGCATAFATGTDATTLCIGTCRGLFNDIISSCDTTVSSAYSTFISTLCDGGTNNTGGDCTTVITSVSNACWTLFVNGNISVCSGTCGAQLSAVVSACANSTDSDIQATLSIYSILCGSGGAECATATAAIIADTICDSNTVSASVLCTGTCRELADNFTNACPANDVTVIAVSEEVDRLCGSLAACTTAISGISTTCLALLNTGNTAACSGSCATELGTAVSGCRTNNTDPQAQVILSVYNTLCSQGDDCQLAQLQLAADTGCLTALSDENAGVFCIGSCRSLIDTFIDACADDGTINSADARAELNRLCGSVDCQRAISGISSICLEMLNDTDYTVCIGTCGTQLETAVTVCNMNTNDTQTEAILNKYNTICTGACIAAASALDVDTNCQNAVVVDERAYCSGRCRTLADAVINACPVNNDDLVDFNRLCGSSVMTKTSGIILLFAAMCALIF